MRCDIISIFPEYLEPLKLSLPGQAQRKGLLDVAVHDAPTDPFTVRSAPTADA